MDKNCSHSEQTRTRRDIQTLIKNAKTQLTKKVAFTIVAFCA